MGLDIIAQAQIRQFVREYNRLTNATVLLTSHYMDDVTWTETSVQANRN